MSMPGAGPVDDGPWTECMECGAIIPQSPDDTMPLCEPCRAAIDADDRDMTEIARQWRDYDTDPPGS